MPLFRTRPATALLGALLCLTACAPTTTVSAPPTATTLPTTSTATSTPALAPTPTNVPVGWKVLATTHFSLEYPSDWTPDTVAVDEQSYVIWAPTKRSAVQVTAFPQADVTTYLTPYCRPESEGAHPTTFANLPMTFKRTGLSSTVRVWRFANAQQTLYLLSTGDTTADAATQAQDEAILTTFRPDNATPWQC